jgi:general secretion pathway protein J
MNKKLKGFTLIEVLIALLIFTIVATLLVGGLQAVINADAGTQQHAKRLHQLQITFLKLSHDLSQTIKRPILTEKGQKEAAFIGNTQRFSCTVITTLSTLDHIPVSALTRISYRIKGQDLRRSKWAALDRIQAAPLYTRILLDDLVSGSFQYLDKEQHLHDTWPLPGRDEVLPRAVKINLTLAHWGEVSQLYVIYP